MAKILDQKIKYEELDRELKRAGFPDGYFWQVYPNRNFDDVPTIRELIAFVKKHQRKGKNAVDWLGEWKRLNLKEETVKTSKIKWEKSSEHSHLNFKAELGNITLSVYPENTQGLFGSKAKRGTAWKANFSHWDGKHTISGVFDYYREKFKDAKEAQKRLEQDYSEWMAGKKKGSIDPPAVKEEVAANNIGSGNIKAIDPPLFGGKKVFDVDPDEYHKARLGKRKHANYKHYLSNPDTLTRVQSYANENPDHPILVRHKGHGAMMYLKYGKQTTH